VAQFTAIDDAHGPVAEFVVVSAASQIERRKVPSDSSVPEIEIAILTTINDVRRASVHMFACSRTSSITIKAGEADDQGCDGSARRNCGR
jgi:hypothetical protein